MKYITENGFSQTGIESYPQWKILMLVPSHFEEIIHCKKRKNHIA